MAFDYKKTITYRLMQAAKAQRVCSGQKLAHIGVYPGQDLILTVLAQTDGLTMGELAAKLAVQPPTVTKMAMRLAAQGLIRREAAPTDARQSHVYLTEAGHACVTDVNAAWRELERQALDGLDKKDRKRLRRLLRLVGKNLARARDTEARESAAPTGSGDGSVRVPHPNPNTIT